MATPDYYLCDLCGKQTKQRLWITLDRRTDAAGGNEDVCESADLCPEHLLAAVEFFLSAVGNPRVADYDQGNRLLAWIRKK